MEKSETVLRCFKEKHLLLNSPSTLDKKRRDERRKTLFVVRTYFALLSLSQCLVCANTFFKADNFRFTLKTKSKERFLVSVLRGNFGRFTLVAPVQFMFMFPNEIECYIMQFPASLLETWTLNQLSW